MEITLIAFEAYYGPAPIPNVHRLAFKLVYRFKHHTIARSNLAFHLMSTSYNPQDSNESTATSNENISHTPSAPSNNMSDINNDQSLQPTQNTLSPSQEPECESQQQSPLDFSNRHKENLEFHLRQFLTDNLVSDSIGSTNSNLINTFQPNTTVQNGDFQPQQGGSSFNSGQN
ncbi:5592_t:CDS:2 [Funneliformis mosseae]|uniref:5592_t:CDS:1 n=1 Tax=Funneliformis mosseae TaxID=27381 RepID=A0A9N9C343_FUNMO|nr:5592_t:CDS:2 [Funneliformis mosseae]